MSRDERVAIHEGGHVVMAYVLKRRLGPISIEGTRHYGGITSHGNGHLDSVPNLLTPLPLQPAAFRRHIESAIMISLAGERAEWLLSPQAEPGYIDPTDEKRAIQFARMASLTPRERDELASADRPLPLDEESANQLAWAAAGQRSAGSYVAWLEDETAHLVQGLRFRQLVDAMAPELVRRGTVSGRFAHRLLREADPWADNPRGVAPQGGEDRYASASPAPVEHGSVSGGRSESWP